MKITCKRTLCGPNHLGYDYFDDVLCDGKRVKTFLEVVLRKSELKKICLEISHGRQDYPDEYIIEDHRNRDRQKWTITHVDQYNLPE